MKHKSYRLILFAIPLLFASCASHKPDIAVDKQTLPISQVDRSKIRDLSLRQIKEHIHSEGSKITSLKSNVDITLITPETKGSFTCKGVFVLQKPEKIRVIGHKLATTVFNMVSDGENFWFYVPQQKTVYMGRCNTKRNVNTNAYLFPDDIAVLLDYDKIFQGRSAYLETWPTFWLIQVFEKKGDEFVPYGRLKISRFDNKITELTLFQEDSLVKVHASFNNYVSLDGGTIPKEVEISWPETDSILNITFKNPSLNDPLKAKVFQFKKPENAEIIRIN